MKRTYKVNAKLKTATRFRPKPVDFRDEPFTLSAHWVCENKKWTLCHGLIYVNGCPMLWAWCEFGGQVYDAYRKKLYTRFEYFKTFSIPDQLTYRYSYRQMRIKLRIHKRYANWKTETLLQDAVDSF